LNVPDKKKRKIIIVTARQKRPPMPLLKEQDLREDANNLCAHLQEVFSGFLVFNHNIEIIFEV